MPTCEKCGKELTIQDTHFVLEKNCYLCSEHMSEYLNIKKLEEEFWAKKPPKKETK